jgi:CheY-like chemotaxis protein
MSILLAAKFAFLAQSYDETGAADRGSILFGILAVFGFFAFAVIWEKLRNAKANEKYIDTLHRTIVELEKKDTTKQHDETRPFTIIHIDDEDWLLEMVGRMIRANQAFKNVIIKTFQNRDEAWRELFHNKDPDLLITDLRSDNVPGRTEQFGMNGLEMLSVLAEMNVKYPVLVFSGSLSIEGYEGKAKQAAGNKLNVSFLKKPATSEQIYSELSKHLGLGNTIAQNNLGFTKAQQDYYNEVVARAGIPSAEAQRQIDKIRGAKTQSELKEIVSLDATVIRPTTEAELLVAVMLAKQAELKAFR